MVLKIINVMASSLDGKISLAPQEPDADRHKLGFVNHDDREFVREQIKTADAIIVGANSIRASGKVWQQKNSKGVYPKWFIYTNSGLEDGLEFWDQAEIARCFVSKKPLKKINSVENLAYHETLPGRFLVDHLTQQKDIETVLLFGGGQVNKTYYQESLVDQLKITICPFLFGAQSASNLIDVGLDSPVALLLNSSHAIGNHVFLSYTVQKD